MPFVTVGFLTEAKREFDEAVRWYERRERGLGYRFLGEVVCSLQQIERAPERWPMISQAARIKVMVRFPYSIIFQHEHSRIVVVAIAHHRRRPGYWRRRKRR